MNGRPSFFLLIVSSFLESAPVQILYGLTIGLFLSLNKRIRRIWKRKGNHIFTCWRHLKLVDTWLKSIHTGVHLGCRWRKNICRSRLCVHDVARVALSSDTATDNSDDYANDNTDANYNGDDNPDPDRHIRTAVVLTVATATIWTPRRRWDAVAVFSYSRWNLNLFLKLF